MPVEKQVMIIYAVTNGFLDTLPVADIKGWESGFLDFAHTQFPQIENAIKTDKSMSKEIEADLKRAIEQFNNSRGTGKAS